MTLSSRDLKRTAHEKLHNAKNQREIILLYAAITLGLGLVILLLQLTLNQKISHTGGLSGMNSRNMLSALSSFLPLVSSIVTMCLAFGYMGGMLRISRGQYASRNALKTGFERFWPLLRLKLLLGAMILGLGFGASYLASLIFMLSPFSDSFMNAVAPAVSGGSLLTGGTITLDETALDAITAASGPLIVIFLALILAFVVPMLYRFRMADYVLYDHPEVGAMYALLASRKMMQGNRWQVFKLDMSFWWYYLITVLAAVLAYGDVLLALVGVSLPMDGTLSYILFYLLSVAATFAQLYFLRNPMEVTYALAYDQLKPREEKQNGAVLGNIFQM